MDIKLNGWRVLAVDDEPDNLKLIADVLEFKGAVVAQSQNGQQGLDMLDTFKPTLVLLDLAMPGVDGWEMHRQLRRRTELNHVPIIALTALAMPQDAERVMAAGFDGYITKPFRFNDLLQELVTTVEKFQARKDQQTGGSHE
jgi:two-component system cell cycle response regulator DivK